MSFRLEIKNQIGGGSIGLLKTSPRPVLWAVAFAALLSQAPTRAWATPVVYDFDPGTQLTFDNGDVETLQGSLTLDYTALVYELDVTLTGDAPEAGQYTGGGNLTSIQRFFDASYKPNALSDIRLTLGLNSSPGTIPLTTSVSSVDASEEICSDVIPSGLNGPHCSVDETFSDPSATIAGGGLTRETAGSPDPTSAPEPISLALFGVGLTGLTASRRRRIVRPVLVQEEID